MKILKFSGIVAGIHLLALILIFANPGCSSSSNPPSPSDTTASSDTPAIAVKGGPSPISAAPSSSTVDPISLNAAVRYSPTRPNSAAATSLQTAPVTNVTPASTYTVVKNDNLTVIAKRNHITIGELAAANNLSPTAKLGLGQKLIIPSKVSPAAKMEAAGASPASSMPAANPGREPGAARAKSADSVTHVVQSGETLGVIARNFGVSQREIAVANNITDPEKIRAGTELIIPGWQTPSGANARSKSVANPPASGAVESSSPALKPAPVAEVPVIKVEDAPPAP
jgi:LysM repeat protein